MKKITLIIFLIISTISYEQTYCRVKIFANESQLEDLHNLAIDLDHAHHTKGSYILAELNENDILKLDQNGINYQIVINDLENYYADRLQQPILKTGAFPCDQNSATKYSTPVNFNLGNMGGYLTYNEFLENLDSMASKYPNLITAKSGISSFQTYEGRPILYVRISDNPGIDEGEAQVLYTSIHHAREPASLSQLIYYMWYLLENYDTDPEIQYLVNNTDMFFVPIINPDGYIYNEVNNPNGGGMWRKNRRNNGGGSFGVDLNRNYSYQWGTTGTSTTNTNDDTYCGTTPFSEPETQAIKWLCENNNFLFASNAHTYGNLLLFPFGHTSNLPTVDHDYYVGIGGHMVKHNGYTSQLSAELYPASGDSDDWMYDGDLGTKPKIFAFTPEIGSNGDGFWPASSEIDRICKENIFPNMRIAHYPHVYASMRDLEPQTWTDNSDYINFELTRYGLTPGDFTVSITPINGFDVLGNPEIITGMQLLDVVNDSISYQLSANLSGGDEIKYVLNLDNGSYVHRDTITKIYGLPTEIFNDPGNDMLNWVSNNWNTTTEDFKTPSSSITDSPNQSYTALTNSSIESLNEYDLGGASQAFVAFWAKWEIENNYDYVQFEVSSDNGNSWIPMCGKYTNLGTSDQAENEPLYDDFQTDWVEELISLDDFLGSTIKFRFRLVSDIFVNNDGFYFDDFRVFTDANGIASLDENKKWFSIYPNPTKSELYLNTFENFNFSFTLTDLNGKTIMKSTSLKGFQKISLDNLERGMYILNLFNSDQHIFQSQKVVKN